MSPESVTTSSIAERLRNPLVLGLLIGLLGYVGISAVMASLSSASHREFIDYLSLLMYPVNILLSTYQLHMELLDDPRGSVNWGWVHAVCASLCVGIPVTLLGSVLAGGGMSDGSASDSGWCCAQSGFLAPLS